MVVWSWRRHGLVLTGRRQEIWGRRPVTRYTVVDFRWETRRLAVERPTVLVKHVKPNLVRIIVSVKYGALLIFGSILNLIGDLVAESLKPVDGTRAEQEITVEYELRPEKECKPDGQEREVQKEPEQDAGEEWQSESHRSSGLMNT
jgi:hypothetical protein